MKSQNLNGRTEKVFWQPKEEESTKVRSDSSQNKFSLRFCRIISHVDLGTFENDSANSQNIHYEEKYKEFVRIQIHKGKKQIIGNEGRS